jgi:hypothetical protein
MTSDRILIVLVSLAGTAAWFAIARSFWIAFRQRRNPVSLAISMLVAFTMYSVPSMCWLLNASVDPRWIVGGIAVLNLCVCALMYWAFIAERRWFPRDDERRQT